jgi:hypothetical protein
VAYNISADSVNNSQVEILNIYLHENVHRIIEKIGVSKNTLESILDEGLSLLPKRTKGYISNYWDAPKYEQGEETLAYSIGNRIADKKIGPRLLRLIEGYIIFEEFYATQQVSLRLRDSYIETILNEFKNEYEAREPKQDESINSESSNRGRTDAGNKGKATQVYDRRWRGYIDGRAETRVERGQGGLLDNTRYSLPDMPFFEDNGDVVSFEAMTPEERIATLLSEKIMNGEGEDAMVFENGKDIEAKSLEGE